MKTKMKIECMYCKKDMGTKNGEGVKGTTSSICEKCWNKNYPQYRYPTEEAL